LEKVDRFLVPSRQWRRPDAELVVAAVEALRDHAVPLQQMMPLPMQAGVLVAARRLKTPTLEVQGEAVVAHARFR